MIYSCVKFIFRKIKIVTKTKMKKKKTVIHFEVDGAFGSSLHRFGDVDNDVAD